MQWKVWRQKLENNAQRPVPAIDVPAGLSPEQHRRVLKSLQRFQLGESGEGRIAHQIDSVKWPGVDADLRALVKLWVREEGRHARILGQMVNGMGGKLLGRHWSARAFEIARRAFGVRWKLLIALAAEVAGTVFYGELARALPTCDLGAALQQMQGDEEAHLRFQSELFGMLSRGPLAAALIQGGWQLCGAGVCVLVWLQHAGTLQALGVSRLHTAKALARCFLEVGQRISQARLPRPAAVPAVA